VFPASQFPRAALSAAPKRKQATSWKDFIRAHMTVLVATDFFTVEVLTLRGLITYYVLFFINLESRRICLAGVTRHPDQEWMEQMTRNVTMEDSGFLINRRYLLHDPDSKYCSSFGQVIEAGSVKMEGLPLVGGGIIQQHNDRATQVPQQLTQKQTDLFLDDVVVKE
jgi:putative transposase